MEKREKVRGGSGRTESTYFDECVGVIVSTRDGVSEVGIVQLWLYKVYDSDVV